ncbi:transcriptional regulator [Arthrobacter sp. ERGS1:01]|uniref:PadR family transcriptional regulator n=1 Tax=Arthrobacter sp. ERGS1:01 TaxID=1704044 RepID=UPI0006B5F9C2|nr:PadR family transcriptional regulator [Arthrobacter sp. ERGS1:01]ALE07052.1 transcriptional regulator [Arthrobacter sp. ERGS1:01]
MTKNAQLTPLGVSALGLLAERPMHPYEMYQLLIHRHEDRLVKVRPGTLYHTVGRLAAANLVEPVGTDREGNRPERTTYGILPAGRVTLERRIKELLAVPVNEYPRFPQALGEAHNLPAGVVVELLDQRLAVLEAELAELDSQAAEVGAKGIEQKFWIDLGYQQAQLGAEIRWVGRLRAGIDSGAIPW